LKLFSFIQNSKPNEKNAGKNYLSAFLYLLKMPVFFLRFFIWKILGVLPAKCLAKIFIRFLRKNCRAKLFQKVSNHSFTALPQRLPALYGRLFGQKCPFNRFWLLSAMSYPPAHAPASSLPFLPRFCLFIKAMHTGGGLIY